MANSIYREELVEIKAESYDRKPRGEELVNTSTGPYIDYFSPYIREQIANIFQDNTSTEVSKLGNIQYSDN